jgi:peptide/nickel transport system substrate-binding protein
MRRVRRRSLVAATMITAVAMVVAACGGGGGGSTVHNAQELTEKVVDLNPRDPATLADGKFIWPLDKVMAQWNYGNTDGRDQNGLGVIDSMMPHLFTIQPDQSPVLNPDYLVSAVLTSTSPQVVTYEINPKATWTDGTPITWQDFQAQWQALSGKDPQYLVATTVGYEDVSTVERGKDDREVKVTFGAPFAEWQQLFTPLYPKQYEASADAFNNALKSTPPKVSAGPFRLQSFDPTAKTVEVERNPGWWGAKPVLSHISFKVVSRDDRGSALENNEITWTPLAVRVDLFQRAQTMPNVSIREAVAQNYNTLGFNGRPGAILADPKVRAAIAEGINPTEFTKAAIGPIEPNPTPIGNNIFLPGTKSHEDHTSLQAFNPDKAKSELDAAGWTLPAGQPVRVKDGKPLELRYPVSNDTEDAVTRAEEAQLGAQLTAIGAKLVVTRLPDSEYDDDVNVKGDFDVTDAGWLIPAYPVSRTTSHFVLTPGRIGQNLGQIGSDRINQLFKQANATFDETERAKLGNEIDQEVWKLAYNVPLYQSPDVVLTDKKLANFGAHGFADIDYTKIGFTK